MAGAALIDTELMPPQPKRLSAVMRVPGQGHRLRAAGGIVADVDGADGVDPRPSDRDCSGFSGSKACPTVVRLRKVTVGCNSLDARCRTAEVTQRRCSLCHALATDVNKGSVKKEQAGVR